jgi:hypothetical protein
MVTHSCKHLCRALAVSNVDNPLLIGLMHDILPKGWLIELSHLREGEAKVLFEMFLFCCCQVNPLVISAVPIASRVIHPKIKPRVDKSQTQAGLSIGDNASATICEPMLIDDHRSRCLLSEILWFFTLEPWNSIHSVYVAIISRVNMLLKWIPHLLRDKPSKSS